ncbi:DUF29 domain-containing protein [Anabaena cylindrica FACHB-243]|uniref:DUF29 domain-containing protein n=1 Tax=Anabaena cylindrica (strain ATCC 27899 / PCC 7122) TaxID=272123 RepID=K9ZJX7_ANACC|nr:MULTISPECIES: DUF29 domain-containing protein [Anabaena]AFZ58842.1 protein of unknown function DUF29 [Anabaena cylindrica PCC 7122]MBD2421532.1 DUF29 domain-containing protein [Anabaena cylindrica FACHB-243]MBY5282835.1 DUF29 domain-containing protein [Anabaena sp. CCAP 1446/1C]MBY5311404.1 DUF29 domain-containing protein [Anabaena sp. CCAP 1446/1C]MCM2410142.1 DUF29 domain-containing protein [Anabaena sp. CCAP 1446/1C]
MTQTQIAVSLYEQDYLLWIEDIVNKLRNRDIEGLDFENLIEEIEDLGRSDKRELESRLRELLEHILKRKYVNMPDCYRGWVESIDKQRIGIRKLLKDSLSLKPYFSQVFDEAYEDTLKIVRRGYPQCKFPDIWPFSRDLEAMLNVDFWD